MNIKKTANLLLNFAIKRLAEILALLFLCRINVINRINNYSPEDPNFIFPENTEIKNLLGFQGSFISDLFFQSSWTNCLSISFTFIITGINIFRIKEFFLIIENTFFYTLFYIWNTFFYLFLFR